MTDSHLRRELWLGIQALELPLDEAQLGLLMDYLALLQKWNRVYNLTAVRDPQDMLRQHLLDSLAAVGPLLRETDGRSARLLDVGAGGGLPGVVFAIACPHIDVTCVDAVAKKAAFLQQVAAALGLPNLHGVHARVESLALPDGRGFDVVSSRAFASLADFVGLTRQVLAPDGAWMALKGRHPQDELDALPPWVAVFHVEPVAVPGLDAERCIVWMRERSPAA